MEPNEEPTFRVSKGWLERHATNSIGWTRKQLAAIGVSWPPKKGWKSRIAGTLISEESRRIFES